MSGYVKLALACLFWGIGWIAARYAVAHIGPYLAGVYRFGIAFLLFLPFLFYPKPLKPSWTTLLYMIPLAITGFFFNNLLGYSALQYTTATSATIIIMSNPINIAILSYIFLKDRLNRAGVLSIVLSVAGALIVVVKGDFPSILSLNVNIGNLLVVGSALCWSAYSILIKIFQKRVTSIENVTYGSLFAAIGFIPFSLAPVPAEEFNALLIGALIFLALFNTNLAFYFWSEGIRNANPNAAAVFLGLIPLTASILENILFGERVASYHMIGGGLIFIGILLYVWSKDNRHMYKREFQKGR